MFPNTDRKINRLKGYNYSSNGCYFITICTHNRKEYLGKIKNGKMSLNKYGEIIKKYYKKIPEYYKNVSIDVFAIMPNHIHGIIIIDNSDNLDVGTEYYSVPTKKDYGLLSKIIKSFKHIVTKIIKNQLNYKDSIWQRSFYDHIIRTEEELNKIREYIINNPLKWESDKNNSENLFI